MHLSSQGPAAAHSGDLIKIIEECKITPHFQPIVDLYFVEVLGYEALSRGVIPFESPIALFGKAEEMGVLWDLERVCHIAALRRIETLPDAIRRKKFFLNVTPQVFSDERFCKRFTHENLQQYALDQRQIVLEITEVHRITDYDLFGQLIRQQSDAGFLIALDDFGAGHSSLTTLVAASPHFLKLDRMIVAGIHKSAYKQNLVKALVNFVASVDSKLIAEGIEEVEELETLLRLGVRYAQGYLFAKPHPEPGCLSEEMRQTVMRLSRRFRQPMVSLQAPTASMALRPQIFEMEETGREDIESFFHATPSADHVVLVSGEKPMGLLTRQRLVHSDHSPLDKLVHMEALTVGEEIDIGLLARLAMDRDQDYLYDPVMVVSGDGDFIGTISVKQILTQTIQMEANLAASANPLTGLPGNVIIESWIQKAMLGSSYSVIYTDLDHFKEYNDAYGFPQGDQLIKLAATVLSEYAPKLAGESHLGHLGADAFVLVCPDKVDEQALQAACLEFDERKKKLFQAGDVERGYFEKRNRRGEKEKVALTTMSLAVVTQDNVGPTPHLGQFGQIAAQLKKKVKDLNAASGVSGYLIDRRRYRSDSSS